MGVAAIGTHAATLHWDPSSGTVDGYKVHYGTSSSNPSNSKDVGSATTYNLDNLPLSENVQYYFSVTAYNSAGESPPCPAVSYSPGDTTPPIPPVGLVAAVQVASTPAGTDTTLTLSSLSVSSGKAYQVRSALANGGTTYIDRSYTFKNVPASLQGATYVMTANADKLNASSQFVSFKVNRNVTVYVAHDNRITRKPAWLGGFTNTGLSLSSDVPMTIYQKSFPSGVVALGGNGGITDSSMYTIAVK